MTHDTELSSAAGAPQGPELHGGAAPQRPPSPMQQVGMQLGDLWWVPLVAGLLSIGLGLAILATDWTVKALVVLTGIVLIVRSVALAFDPSYAKDTAWGQVVAGVAGVIAGVVLIAWPGPTLLVLAVILGAFLAVSGAFRVVSCIARRAHMEHWGLGAAIGVIELLFGLWVMRRPEVTLALIVTIIGLWTVITGVICCVQAFEIRSVARQAKQTERRTVDIRDRDRAQTPAAPWQQPQGQEQAVSAQYRTPGEPGVGGDG